MRRRRQSLVAELGIPESLAAFTPEQWDGSSDFQRWRAWDEARTSWAAENLPNGTEDLPGWDGIVPDQPWSEVEL